MPCRTSRAPSHHPPRPPRRGHEPSLVARLPHAGAREAYKVSCKERRTELEELLEG
ncbi:hypothetical protein [Streptomyces lavendulocolor]|uniref:hypothetical protein n=1 Tax=Streptomyces lavendulocolor TaxID=67316 RepID=UPI0031D44D91